MNHSLWNRMAVSLAGVVVSMLFVVAAKAQSANDVPWAQVPDDLKQAVQSVAETYGKPNNLPYSGSCETGVQGKLCARVLTLDANKAHIGIGLYQSEAAFFDLTRTSAGWATAPAAPGTGNSAGRTADGVTRFGSAVLAVGLGLAAAGTAAAVRRRRPRSV